MFAIAWRLAVLITALPVAYILTPIILLPLTYKAKHLPYGFRWMETWDNDINGDAGWASYEHANGRQRTYWWRCKWLWRNPCGNLRYHQLGIDLSKVARYEMYGDVRVNNRPPFEGIMEAVAVMEDGKERFVLIAALPHMKDRCIFIYIGWKFRRNLPIDEWPHEGRADFVFTINPFSGFKLGFQ